MFPPCILQLEASTALAGGPHKIQSSRHVVYVGVFIDNVGAHSGLRLIRFSQNEVVFLAAFVERPGMLANLTFGVFRLTNDALELSLRSRS